MVGGFVIVDDTDPSSAWLDGTAALPAMALDGTAARTCHKCKEDIVTSVFVEERTGQRHETTGNAGASIVSKTAAASKFHLMPSLPWSGTLIEGSYIS